MLPLDEYEVDFFALNDVKKFVSDRLKQSVNILYSACKNILHNNNIV